MTNPTGPDIKYIDLPDLKEIFADDIGLITAGNQEFRAEFQITRMDEPKAGRMSGRKYPVCRLVLSNQAFLKLLNQLEQIAGAMEAQGVLKRKPAENTTPEKTVN